jgi:hypothetical protein
MGFGFRGQGGGVLSSMSEIYLVGKWMERGRAILRFVGRGDLVTVSDIGIFARIQNFWNLLPAAGRFTLTIYLLYYIYYYLK